MISEDENVFENVAAAANGWHISSQVSIKLHFLFHCWFTFNSSTVTALVDQSLYQKMELVNGIFQNTSGQFKGPLLSILGKYFYFGQN